MPPESPEITGLLRLGRQDAAALDAVDPSGLQRTAARLSRRYMRDERAENTLQTTALVSKAYLRLVDAKRVAWQDRSPFLRGFGSNDAADSGGRPTRPEGSSQARRPGEARDSFDRF